MVKERMGSPTMLLPLLTSLMTTTMAPSCGRPTEDLRRLVNKPVETQAAQQESLLPQSEQLSDACLKRRSRLGRSDAANCPNSSPPCRRRSRASGETSISGETNRSRNVGRSSSRNVATR